MLKTIVSFQVSCDLCDRLLAGVHSTKRAAEQAAVDASWTEYGVELQCPECERADQFLRHLDVIDTYDMEPVPGRVGRPRFWTWRADLKNGRRIEADTLVELAQGVREAVGFVEEQPFTTEPHQLQEDLPDRSGQRTAREPEWTLGRSPASSWACGSLPSLSSSGG